MAFVTPHINAHLEKYVDMYFSIDRIRAAYGQLTSHNGLNLLMVFPCIHNVVDNGLWSYSI
jgi:hypothetical protein